MAAAGLVPALLLALFEMAFHGFGDGVSASLTIAGTPGAKRRILRRPHFDKRFSGPGIGHVIASPSSVLHPAAKVAAFNASHI